MISQDDLAEGVSIIATMSAALLGSIDVTLGIASANAKYAVDDLNANAEFYIRSARIGTPLADTFEAIFAAGASIEGLEAARAVMVALSPSGSCARTLIVAGINLLILLEARIYTQITFTSRQDVDAAIILLRESFASALEVAADNSESQVYQSLQKALGDIVTHLNTTARPLPNVIKYNVSRILTSHALAQRLYGDASRADQLMLENKSPDPHFMPATGTALSS